MKRSLFFFVILISALSVSAQVKQEVIATAGGYTETTGLSLSWTLGETIIPTYKSGDGSLILTHGFQQKLIITTVEENLEIFVNIKVFPNPASEVLNIQFEDPIDGEVILSILDSQGKLVKRDMIESSVSEKQVNMQELPAGIYFIKLTKGRLFNTYKVVKL